MASVRPEVKKLFDRISELLANATDAAGQTDMEFLKEIREGAHRNKRDWQTRLDPYMHCLKDQGKISSEALSELLALASECRMPAPGAWEVFSPLGMDPSRRAVSALWDAGDVLKPPGIPNCGGRRNHGGILGE